MHITAMQNCRHFYEFYVASRVGMVSDYTVVEIGSQNVNGSLRELFDNRFKYIGVDFVEGNGVDVVLGDPYKFPFPDNYADCIVCSSVLEHSEFFWVVFLEIMRILKPNGVFYMNAPSNGTFHRYPVDCWRFYPDSGRALANWANHNGMSVILLESYTSLQQQDPFNDFVAVFLKDGAFLDQYPDRILNHVEGLQNGLTHPNLDQFHNEFEWPEDQRKLLEIGRTSR